MKLHRALAPTALAFALAAPSLSQSTRLRDYSAVVDLTQVQTTQGTAPNSLTFLNQQQLPAVSEEPGAALVAVEWNARLFYMLSYTLSNPTAQPALVGTGFSDWDLDAVMGDPASVGIGCDGCFGCNASGGGASMVPANGVLVEQFSGSSSLCSAFAGATLDPAEWLMARDVFLNQRIGGFGGWNVYSAFEYIGDPGTVESTLTLRTRVEAQATMELSRQNLTTHCASLANSAGTPATVDWYGSLDAGTQMAEGVASAMPSGVPAACIITTDFDPMPAGLGTTPVSCLRGQRRMTSVTFSAPGALGGAAEAVFGADLAGFLPGETFAVQVLYRDGSSWNSTDVLTGTAQ